MFKQGSSSRLNSKTTNFEFLSLGRIVTFFLFPLFFFVVACGGGGSKEQPTFADNGGSGGGGATNTTPVVSISSPSNNSSFDEEALISFVATANDAEDGDITSSIIWQSSRDGNIGSGGSISKVLSVGTHTITASASDSQNSTGQSSVTVTVNGGITLSVDAGSDRSVLENESVSLTATASGSSNYSYQWTQTSGASVTINNATSQTMSFTAPTLNAGESRRVLIFQILVSDNQNNSAVDSVSVTVQSPDSIAECDITISPGESIDSAMGQLGTGETLCLNDGTYLQSMDVPSNVHVRAVNDGMAEIDGGSERGLDWQGGVLTMSGSNSSVRGLRVHHGSTNADACTIKGDNNRMKAMSCAHGGSYKHSIPLQVGGSGHLIEDSWFFGEGRYVVMCFEGSNITFRRNVMRWDSTAPNEPTEPNAAISNYSCSDMIWENNISLDYGQPETRMVYCGDICMSSNENRPNERVKWLGNVVFNHHEDTDNNRAFRADQKGTLPSNDIEIRDFYMKSVARGMVFNSLYEDVTIENCTSIDVQLDGQLDGNDIVCTDDADLTVQYVNGVKTSTPLFPLEFEDLIKRDMCRSGERQSGWCSSGLSLQAYIFD